MALSCPNCDFAIGDELPRLADADAKLLCPQCQEPLTLPEMTMPISIADTPLMPTGSRPSLDPNKKYALLIVTGKEAGKVLDVEKTVVTIGRSGCDLLVDDPELSRRHARVEFKGDEITLKDLDSTNGTYMDDERIGEVLIDNRSKFRVGSHEIALVITDRDV
jgi:S-DNA-T family DNA segregation ATPase FtsK/SpoIIIE